MLTVVNLILLPLGPTPGLRGAGGGGVGDRCGTSGPGWGGLSSAQPGLGHPLSLRVMTRGPPRFTKEENGPNLPVTSNFSLSTEKYTPTLSRGQASIIDYFTTAPSVYLSPAVWLHFSNWSEK